jgi:peptidoglycan/LPS O-acetylase OafA/YrhL
MGLLRFLLAACVIAGHSSAILGLPLLDAGLAVKTFFMISGFYMTLILTSKYHVERGGYWLFISNRFLRIYPSYFVVLAVSLLFYAAASFKLHAPADRLAYWVQAWHTHHFCALACILVSQVSIVGLDITPLLEYSATGGFGWVGSMGDSAIHAWRFNFLPHCWSISVELIFYLAAPLICLARRWAQVGLLVAGLAAYMAAWRWLPAELAGAVTYHFFPFQIGYLVLGVLSFHLLHPLFEKGRIHAGWSWGVLPPFAVTILFYGWLPAWVSEAGCIGLGFFAVPLLFNLSRRARLDRFIGDLSYPMYLSHVTCKWVLLAVMGVSKKDTAVVPGWELLLLTVLASVVLVWLVDYPVDRWRQARVAANTGAGLRAKALATGQSKEENQHN